MDLGMQVKEMAELLEDQLGLVHGWLMSEPCKVGDQSITYIVQSCQYTLESRLDLWR